MRKFALMIALVVLVALASGPVARATIIVDALLSNTSQFRTALQTPYFGTGNPGGGLSQKDVVGVSFNYGGGLVTSGTKLLGVGFDNINLSGVAPPTGPFALTQNGVGPSVTLDMPFTSSNSNRGGAIGAVGTDTLVVDTIGSQGPFLLAGIHPTARMVFTNLSPNTDVYVQGISSFFGGATAQYGVTANGVSQGTWTTASATSATPGSILAFTSTTDDLGTLDILFTVDPLSGFGQFSGILISEQIPVPEPSTCLLLGLGLLSLVRHTRRRRRRV